MPSARDDHLVRLVQQANATARRIREQLLGGTAARELVPDVRAAEDELLGAQAELLRRLDAHTAGELLGDAQRLKAWAALLRVESEIYRAASRADAATHSTRRADALERVAKERELRG